jgi:hypothetical protein
MVGWAVGGALGDDFLGSFGRRQGVITSVAGEQFEYGFDDIGNRVSQKRGGDANGANLRSTTYVVNPLNQITNRTVVGSRYLDLIGLAEPGTTVIAGGVIASRRGEC